MEWVGSWPAVVGRARAMSNERPGTCGVGAKCGQSRCRGGVEDAVSEEAGERLAMWRGQGGGGRCCNAL